jgi:hypothetical protein
MLVHATFEGKSKDIQQCELVQRQFIGESGREKRSNWSTSFQGAGTKIWRHFAMGILSSLLEDNGHTREKTCAIQLKCS